MTRIQDIQTMYWLSGIPLVIWAIIQIRFFREFRFYFEHGLQLASVIFMAAQMALIVAVAYSSVESASRSQDNGVVQRDEQMRYSADLVYLLALYASKFSTLRVAYRFSSREFDVLTGVAVLAMASATTVGIAMVATGCETAPPWKQTGGQCTGLYKRWIATEVLGVSVEAFPFFIAMKMIYNLQTPWKVKIRPFILFSLRVVIIPVVCVRLYTLRQLQSTATSVYDLWPVVLWAEVHLVSSICTCSAPSIGFIYAFSVNMGVLDADSFVNEAQVHSQRVQGGCYELRPTPIQRSRSSQLSLRSFTTVVGPAQKSSESVAPFVGGASPTEHSPSDTGV